MWYSGFTTLTWNTYYVRYLGYGTHCTVPMWYSGSATLTVRTVGYGTHCTYVVQWLRNLTLDPVGTRFLLSKAAEHVNKHYRSCSNNLISGGFTHG
jgi:hypothetical protein